LQIYYKKNVANLDSQNVKNCTKKLSHTAKIVTDSSTYA